MEKFNTEILMKVKYEIDPASFPTGTSKKKMMRIIKNQFDEEPTIFLDTMYRIPNSVSVSIREV